MEKNIQNYYELVREQDLVLTHTLVNIQRNRSGAATALDDSLDVAAVHGIGGILGTLMLSYLGQLGVLGGQGISKHESGQYFTWDEQLTVQFKGCLATIALSVVATYVIVKITGAVTNGIRVSEEDETKGLDQAEHGENGYSLQ